MGGVLPPAVRRPQKKYAPGFLEHVSCGFSRFLSILGSPPSCATGGGCLRRFGDLRKNTPLDFWSMYLVDLVDIWRTLWPSGLGEPGVQGLGEPPGDVGGTAGAEPPEGIPY